MKNLSIFAAILFAVVLGNNVNAQNSSEASSSASAELISPITITNEVPLNFGKIAKSDELGTVVISHDGSNTATYSPATMKTTLISPTAAKFNITGDKDEKFSVTLPSSIKISKGSDEMTITPTMNLTATNNVLGATATELYVGGTLTIPAAQPIGSYTGTFNVTVSYE